MNWNQAKKIRMVPVFVNDLKSNEMYTWPTQLA